MKDFNIARSELLVVKGMLKKVERLVKPTRAACKHREIIMPALGLKEYIIIFRKKNIKVTTNLIIKNLQMYQAQGPN